MRSLMFTALCLALIAPFLSACEAPPKIPSGQSPLYASLARPGAGVDAALAVRLINDYRRNAGLAPVRLDPALNRFAEAQVTSIAGHNNLTIPGGSEVIHRLKAAGLPATAARENVSAGYYSMSDAFSGWRGSPPNDATLRLAAASRMGIATRYVPNSRYGVYWVLVMAGG